MATAVPLLDGAACRDHPHPGWWFGDAPAERKAALWVCRSRCPVLAECREWALSQVTAFGVLGGMTSGERAAERRRLRRELEAAGTSGRTLSVFSSGAGRGQADMSRRKGIP